MSRSRKRARRPPAARSGASPPPRARVGTTSRRPPRRQRRRRCHPGSRTRSAPRRGEQPRRRRSRPVSACATASATRKSGTQMPSLSPLSTFRPCRIRNGRRGSVTTAWPSAASVGASTTARTRASAHVDSPRTPRAARKPATSVSGRPIPSNLAGIPSSLRSARTSMREASAKSTRVKVASARSLTVSPAGGNSTRPSASAPTSRPTPVNTIADVIGVPAMRPEIAAKASSASARVASAHVTAGSDGDAYGEGRDPDDGAEEEDAAQCDGDLP